MSQLNCVYDSDNYNYDRTYFISDNEPIQVTCTIHKYTFDINIKIHLKYGGCKYCNLDFNFNNFQEKSNLKFNNNFIIDKNTYTNDHYRQANHKLFNEINVKCITHDHNFLIKPDKHLTLINGGCIKCKQISNSNLYENLIKKSKDIFNDNYDFTNFEYISLIKPSFLRCKKHDILITISPRRHLDSLNGGCLICKKQPKKEEPIENNKLNYDEEFRILNLPNYDNLYKISNYGKVYSLKHNMYIKSRKVPSGYMKVNLYNQELKNTKVFNVNKLVMFVFQDNPENKKCIEHIDKCKQNNYYKNLKWVSKKEQLANNK